jgi:hypothetical protein
MRFASPEANVFPEGGYIVVKLPDYEHVARKIAQVL